VRLLRGIRGLLYDDGMTIKGRAEDPARARRSARGGARRPADGEAVETAALPVAPDRRAARPRAAAPDSTAGFPARRREARAC
jgi:hypothetical protein